MKRPFRKIAALTWAALALGYSPLWAQKPKSIKEQQALMAVQTSKTADERIAAIEKVLTDFADTEFKMMLLQMAVQVEQQKGDYAQTVFYANRILKEDPKNALALVTLASETARHTRENDLDRDEQLAKVDKWGKDGIEAAKTMPKNRADTPDAEWEGVRKDTQADGYIALGMADAIRKNYDGAVTNYNKAIEVGSTPNPGSYVRLAQVYMITRKWDDANSTLDKALAMPNVQPQVKTIAEGMKNDIVKRRSASPGAASPAAATPASPATSPTPATPPPPAKTGPGGQQP